MLRCLDYELDIVVSQCNLIFFFLFSSYMNNFVENIEYIEGGAVEHESAFSC